MKESSATDDLDKKVRAAAALIRSARYLTAFTGAGISVESGIPPFRGPGGLWGKYDPRTLEIDYFLSHPDTAWPVIREIFYDNFGRARPNDAHLALARLESAGTLKVLITQNIDNLHHLAGSRDTVEFHAIRGFSPAWHADRRWRPRRRCWRGCPCGGVYKPVFSSAKGSRRARTRSPRTRRGAPT